MRRVNDVAETRLIERDERGKFAKGNRGGPGRPTANKEREYLQALGSVVSIGDWKAIAIKAKEDAIAGDRYARDWLSKYLIGPAQNIMEAAMEEREDPDTGQRIRRLAILMRSMTALAEEMGDDTE